jgi:hypothetical protein
LVGAHQVLIEIAACLTEQMPDKEGLA